MVTMPRGNAPAGRYVASISNVSTFHSRIPVIVDTRANGFQKTIAFTGGVVFTTLPELQTLPGNPSDMSALLYGYLARRA
jgi:hypothetical protein